MVYKVIHLMVYKVMHFTAFESRRFIAPPLLITPIFELVATLPEFAHNDYSRVPTPTSSRVF